MGQKTFGMAGRRALAILLPLAAAAAALHVAGATAATDLATALRAVGEHLQAASGYGLIGVGVAPPADEGDDDNAPPPDAAVAELQAHALELRQLTLAAAASGEPLPNGTVAAWAALRETLWEMGALGPPAENGTDAALLSHAQVTVHHERRLGLDAAGRGLKASKFVRRWYKWQAAIANVVCGYTTVYVQVKKYTVALPFGERGEEEGAWAADSVVPVHTRTQRTARPAPAPALTLTPRTTRPRPPPHASCRLHLPALLPVQCGVHAPALQHRLVHTRARRVRGLRVVPR